jgi:hypothetical protein
MTTTRRRRAPAREDVMPDMSVLRKNMVRYQIAARGVKDEKILDGMLMVPTSSPS